MLTNETKRIQWNLHSRNLRWIHGYMPKMTVCKRYLLSNYGHFGYLSWISRRVIISIWRIWRLFRWPVNQVSAVIALPDLNQLPRCCKKFTNVHLALTPWWREQNLTRQWMLLTHNQMRAAASSLKGLILTPVVTVGKLTLKATI